MTNKIIPFIGDPTYNCPYPFYLEDIGFQVEELTYAHEGIERILEKTYPLIIVNDIMYAGDLDIPNEILLDAYPKISQYVIRQIRNSKLNEDTPIIAKLTSSDVYTDSDEYISAGASDISIGVKEFQSVIEKYLK